MALIDDLISHWRLNEASGNALDAHGSNHGVETSGTIASASGLFSGTARDFEEGDTEWFAVPSVAGLQTGDTDWSILFWVKPETTAFLIAVSKGWAAASELDREFMALIVSGVIRLTVRKSGAETMVEATNHGALSTSVWSMVALGHNATANDIWISINAGTPNTAATSAGVNSGTADLAIGAGPQAGVYYDGLMNAGSFFKRDIRADLTAHYNGGSGLAYPFGAVSAPSPRFALLGVS